jgi:Tol biopolymer transport system component
VPDGDFPDWSTRGWIAFVRRRAVYRVRPDGTGLKLLARRSVGPAWSPDGRTLAVSYLGVWDRAGRSIRRGGVLLMDASGRHRRLVHPVGVGDPGPIAWSPNGRRLLILPYDLLTIDLRGRVIRNHDEGEATGAEYGHQTYGIDWRPHQR